MALLLDEYDAFCAKTFISALESAEHGFKANFEVVSMYADKYDFDKLELWDIVQAMTSAATSATLEMRNG
ncbi:MAG: hypothetical protein AB7D29_07760 [Campylobacterales bacterium]